MKNKKQIKTDDSKDSLWMSEHPEEIYKYEGEWVAVVGEKIVAHGTNLKQVVKKAKKHGDPLLEYVVEEGDVSIYGIFYKMKLNVLMNNLIQKQMNHSKPN
ncbi:MAG: hypothetical protein FVQ77_10950 [Cytophagales bacterium]|nr:hypothetical protein [Cytophagales bacterium]